MIPVACRVPFKSKGASLMEMVLGMSPTRAACLKSNFLCGIVAVTMLLSFIGCSRIAPTGSVTGTVRFAGKPVVAGRLTLLCEGGGEPVFFADISDGVYRLAKAPVGRAKVTVQAFAAETSNNVSSPVSDTALPGGTPPMPIATSIPRQGKPFHGFPERYLNPKTSGLMCEIKPGTQSQDFDLVP